jgi:ABC-2 type transport system ATP-binding protein
MDNVIGVKNLVREYLSEQGTFIKDKKKIVAVNNISFDVSKGEIFGILGPNGAGKTTIIKILTTLLAPTSGEAKVLGYHTYGEEKNIRHRINFIFGGERNLYWRLSARDNLIYFSDLYKISKKVREKRIPELLERVGLTDRADELVENYSKGMKQRLQIARGLINDPEIVFLDEPTLGLDPVGARDLRKIIANLAELKKTVVLTTHYMYEADELCDRIAIINKGKLVCLDTPKNLKKLALEVPILELKVLGIDNQKVQELKNIKEIEAVVVKQEEQVNIVEIQSKEPSGVLNKVVDIFKDTRILGINMREATLEDVYIKLVEGS